MCVCYQGDPQNIIIIDGLIHSTSCIMFWQGVPRSLGLARSMIHGTCGLQEKHV